ncbi:hypothetical protein BDM02DRAFT_3122987 [Thelephora ganbajun]|uniref:Uncharacterized protein n=1 Tax=Thelephora ganbajun TaxID=370292 RepID=A0ACB6Z2F8_THEGA|nr:hypothetical protein BDM02DRAFT_3122987 [Thelephora ganbajun]
MTSLLKDFFSGGRRNNKDSKSSSRDRQHSGGSLSSSQQDLCEVCGRRPKYVEKTGLVHPYCGRTCARAHQSTCKYPSCNNPGKSAFSGYCGPGHARDAVQHGHALPCAECGRQPQAIGDLCLGCNNSIGKSNEPRLKELSLQDPKADSLITHFYHQWKGSEPVKIGKVYEIRLPRSIAKAREGYSSRLAALEMPRQIQTFYSTQCICDLGTNSTKFCTWQSCGICAIIKSAFAIFEFGAKSNSGRFGSGVYSYLEPSLADRHAVSTISSSYRVMLACEVNLLPHRVQPPISSEVVQSHEDGPLVFVSGAEAIVPKYLILYSKPSTTSPTGSHGRVSVYG